MRLLLILMLCGCGYISDAQNNRIFNGIRGVILWREDND